MQRPRCCRGSRRRRLWRQVCSCCTPGCCTSCGCTSCCCRARRRRAAHSIHHWEMLRGRRMSIGMLRCQDRCTQFITGPCTQDGDCASTCCGAKTGVCNARAVAEGPGGGGCGGKGCCRLNDSDMTCLMLEGRERGRDDNHAHAQKPSNDREKGRNTIHGV
ncbi:hypothetical protein B0H14DRAFT_3875492 [Mycena olivaceomarginata]|nr:hypothetical protein B0H14DRAFT_3875492 [Mycena olivaceomarginata]